MLKITPVSRYHLANTCNLEFFRHLVRLKKKYKYKTSKRKAGKMNLGLFHHLSSENKVSGETVKLLKKTLK